jgi:hypothetical protein
VILFGSLVRGNWDEYSDIDLDLVIADEVTLDAEAELKQLCAFLGPVALIVPNGSDSGDVVLDSLLEFSIRYHPLSSTSPNAGEGRGFDFHRWHGQESLPKARLFQVQTRLTSWLMVHPK